MESIEWFFVLVCETQGRLTQPLSRIFCQHDNNKDGYLTKDEVIQLSESLLVKSLLLSVTAQTDVPLLPVHLPQ